MKYFLEISKVTIVLSIGVQVTRLRIGYTLFTQPTHDSTFMVSSTILFQSSPSIYTYRSWTRFQCL